MAKKKAAKKTAKKGMTVTRGGTHKLTVECPIGTHPEVVIIGGVATVVCVPD